MDTTCQEAIVGFARELSPDVSSVQMMVLAVWLVQVATLKSTVLVNSVRQIMLDAFSVRLQLNAPNVKVDTTLK